MTPEIGKEGGGGGEGCFQISRSVPWVEKRGGGGCIQISKSGLSPKKKKHIVYLRYMGEVCTQVTLRGKKRMNLRSKD